MLNERKLTENELEQRKIALKGLLKNKRALVKKYGADAEKVMYGIATKQAKKKIENMNLENLKSMIKDALTRPVKEQSPFVLAADAARDAGKKEFEFPKGSGKMHPVTIKTDIKEDIEDFEVDSAIGELGDIIRDIDEKADEARNIVRDIFPNELSRLDAYGAFNMTYSNNRYDVTLGRFVERLEEEGYEIEDGQVYVNEGDMMPMDDLDVGHIDDEPGMLKSELARAGKMIQMLYRAIDKYDDQGEVDFPQWWQKKIIKANSMLDSAFDYLDGQESVAKIDAMIDTINEEEDEVKKRLAVDKAVKSTLKDEGGAAGIDPLAKAVKKLGVSKDQLKSMIKKIVGVTKHKHGDYISTPINEKELSKSEKKVLKKIEKELRKASKSHKSQSSALAKSTKAHKSQADRIAKLVKEKLSIEEEIEEMKHPQYSTASNRYASRARRPGKFANSPELEKELSDFKSRLKAIQARIAKEKGVEEKKLTAAEKKKKEDIIMALKKQKGGKKNLEPVDYAVATDRAKKLAEKNEK